MGAAPAFPPVRQGAAPPPNPTGQVLGQAKPAGSPLLERMKQATQTIVQFGQAVKDVNPEAAQEFQKAGEAIVAGMNKLLGAGRSPAAPPGAVPAPAPPGAQGPPPPETPEASGV